MGRGLDGYFLLFGLVRFSSSTGAVSQYFRWCIAKGKHLFPFRTEQLSLSAPMVLGGQPPGRVGRRRFLLLRARPRSGSICLRARTGLNLPVLQEKTLQLPLVEG